MFELMFSHCQPKKAVMGPPNLKQDLKLEPDVFRKCAIKCLTIFDHNLKQCGLE